MTNSRGRIILCQADRVSLEYPILYGLSDTDRYRERRFMQFEIREGHRLRAVTDPLDESDPPA